MDDEELQKQIEERVAQLPEETQRAIASAELSKHIQAIGQKHQLHIDQMGLLEDEIMLAMLGFIDPADFVSVLEQQVKISPEKARALTVDIQDEIFTPVREAMKFSTPEKASAPTKLPSTPPNKPVDLPLSAEMQPADIVLTQKTVSMPPVPVPQKAPEPPKPAPYKADPYREPTE
jgi:hypothetical protein